MITALVLVFISAAAHAHRPFNITHLIIPEVVPPGQTEVEIECRYVADFTLLNWFKGPNEFLRYKPGTAPSIKSFSVLGVGRIDVIECGPSVCKLRLAALTEEATGLYRCDIEREGPPYKFGTKKAYMTVHGVEHRRPLLQGVAEEYGEGDVIEAYCRGVEGSELRWYVNGREMSEMRGSFTFKKTSSRLMFMGVPPAVNLQCAEFRNELLLGSKEVRARWKEPHKVIKAPEEQRNCSSESTLHSSVFFIAWTMLSVLNVFVCN